MRDAMEDLAGRSSEPSRTRSLTSSGVKNPAHGFLAVHANVGCLSAFFDTASTIWGRGGAGCQ